MQIALTPRGSGWTFHVINDGDRPIDELVVESIDAVYGPIAPGARVAIDGEPRTSITLRVREGAVEARWIAEAGEGALATLESAAPPAGTIELDARGVRRWRADGTAESARWSRLVAIELVTTDGGPAADDVLWVLHEDVGGCVIPSTAADADALVARVTALPGFDHATMIDAMASTRDARFLVWRRPGARPS